jgi:hypothetical protein
MSSGQEMRVEVLKLPHRGVRVNTLHQELILWSTDPLYTRGLSENHHYELITLHTCSLRAGGGLGRKKTVANMEACFLHLLERKT